ncbi:hypothetical protein BK139_10200 [Paenibacillus sp. FSL R5-0490]|uniref:hypothetical protein n=1 Tax=Bacillales TaxID=1385 RepID=UPI00096D72B0|nr:hypothetical protein [Paenibacillus sp. FSL R5-0490]OMF60303.1 hypothetical protein BK139_10200 [Paenibacillus sp. FSL R5-0490]
MVTGTSECFLCKEKKPLKASHIIPKFVGKWLKDTSATGYLRETKNADRRQQDITKLPLLCNDCEQLFSKSEKLFAEKIFKPFQDGEKRFDYNIWLIYFVISVQWRIITTQKDTAKEIPDFLLSHLDTASAIWREFLLGNSNNVGSYAHHMFFLDTIATVGDNLTLPDKPNMYLLRSIDSTIASNGKDTLFVYTKLPGIIIVSHIYPNNMRGWDKTKIVKRGTIKIPQVCAVKGFGEFLNHRIEESRNYTISENQITKINEEVRKNEKHC